MPDQSDTPRPPGGCDPTTTGGAAAAKSGAAGLRYRVVPFECKADESASPEAAQGGFSGIGAVFHNIDSCGDIILPGAFSDNIGAFLSDGFIGGLNHDWDCPIGQPVEARETDKGLFIRAILDDTEHARDVRQLMKPNPATGRATVRKLSIGYWAVEYRVVKGLDEVMAYWSSQGYTPSDLDRERADGEVRLLTRVRLYEVSPVTVPANDRAVVLDSKVGRVVSRATYKRLAEAASALRGHFKGAAEACSMLDDFLAEHGPADEAADDGAESPSPSSTDDPSASKGVGFDPAVAADTTPPSLADRSERLVADLEELTDLYRKAIESRAAEGRTLSAPKWDAIGAVHDGLASLLAARPEVAGSKRSSDAPAVVADVPLSVPPDADLYRQFAESMGLI